MNHRTFTRRSAVAVLGIVGAFASAQDPGRQYLRDRVKEAPDPIAYHDQVRSGFRLFAERKYHEAADTFQQALRAYPEDGIVWLYLGLALNNDKRPKEAIGPVETALRLKSSGQPPFIGVWLARIYLAAGDKAGAYRSLERAIFDEPQPNRQGIYDDAGLAPLKGEERFKKLTGHFDTSKMSRTEGWRFDIDYLVEELRRVNHKYHNQPFPAEFMKRYRNLKRDVPKLTDDQVYIGMGSMLSTLHQAHISLAILPETKLTPFRALPLQFYIFPEGVFVVGSDEKNKDLLGTELLKIEETSPGEILRQVEEHSSVENPMRIVWGGVGPLGMMQVLHGLGVLRADRQVARLTLRSPDGKTFERTLGFVAEAPNRKLIPPPSVPAPLFLKDVPRAHWFEPLPGGEGLFVQLNQVTADPDETLPQFGLKLRKYLQENPAVKNIVLDLRHNNGGNTMTYPELLRTLVGFSVREGNHLYVIIGRGVYSATGNLITDLERLASPVFVGEPSSGFGNQDGDESRVILPYSGILALLASVWWQYSHPWDKRTSIIPDVPVQLHANDYFAGKDPALETILKMIRRGE